MAENHAILPHCSCKTQSITLLGNDNHNTVDKQKFGYKILILILIIITHAVAYNIQNYKKYSCIFINSKKVIYKGRSKFQFRIGINNSLRFMQIGKKTVKVVASQIYMFSIFDGFAQSIDCTKHLMN